ncbi:MAG: PA2169 family four-helix-bundle protein [Pirellulales bacterium]
MTDTKDTAAQLNNLIEICKDGEEGFKQAADNVKCQDLRSTLMECSRQRAEFASALQSQVARFGQTPEKGGSMLGSMHRGWINLKTAFTTNDDQAVINECERGEDSAVAAYVDAMKKELPTDVQSLVSRQYQTVKATHDKIRDIRDSGKLTAKA